MIQAFTIHRKLLNCLTNELYVDYSFAGKEGLKSMCETFAGHIEGNRTIDRMRRDWFMTALEDYLNHKRHIIENGHHQDQQKAFTVCWDAYERFDKLSTENICSQFLKGFEWFVKILPSDQNKSYASSLHNLTELKKFCENYK